MSEENEQLEPRTPDRGVGETLRRGREAQGLTLEQIAAETRIALRHLEHMEAGEFAALPGRTYAVGFAKTYAKTVGLDEGAIADQVREEMQLDPIAKHATAEFEPGELVRGPSGTLVWFSIFAVVLLLAGLFFAGRTIFGGEVAWEPLAEQDSAETTEELQVAESEVDDAQDLAGGPVVFTAQDVVWVRFTDAAGSLLMEKELATGETYTVPANADNPVLITGRPDLLAITIGGQSVPVLSTEPETLVDVPVSAAALLARQEPPSTQQAAGQGEDAGPAQASAQSRPNTQRASSPARASRPRPPAAPRPAPADAESAAEAPAPVFVSRPVVQGVSESDGARPSQDDE